MMIDMNEAYHAIDTILGEHGMAGHSYCLSLEIWNHRHPPRPHLPRPQITFSISVVGSGEEGVLAFIPKARTIDDALAQLRVELTKQMLVVVPVVEVPS